MSASVGPRPLVVHVRWDDPSLGRQAARTTIDELVGDADRGLTVSEFSGDDYSLAAVVDAARTPSMFTPYRVVVAWGFERFKADELEVVIGYLDDVDEGTSLVLIQGPQSEGRRQPKALTDALKRAGATVVDAKKPSGKGLRDWVEHELSISDVRLDPAARSLVTSQLGEDVSRLPGVLAALTSSFGPGARLGVDEVAPFLGGAGGAPPWDLTDAIDKGDPALALEKLHRMMEAGGRHPLAIMSSLQAHVSRWLRLHGSGASTEKEAAEVLGIKPFPARKALDRAQYMGGARIGRAVELLAEADLQLRGAIAWPPEQVLDVLVVRLCRLAR